MRSRWLLVLVILLIAAVVSIVHYRNLQSDDGILHASGTIEATKVDVSFQIGGRVAEVTATPAPTMFFASARSTEAGPAIGGVVC